MPLILRIYADFETLVVNSLIYPRVSAQSASSAFYALTFSDTLYCKPRNLLGRFIDVIK